ncbi:methyl-CpG-binding domain protein 3 isoform X2 [Neodiprion pinetum]|uniref:Methyl-CpG-binding domain protein 3 isoform X2 n=1 Tax=Neodiprion lecontei TaxID=441921 RepID=A0A6J0BD12_NEOLC|nr:methyl-CpG-binding domain protein 3 isoform X2 [Neodiprion lecontei]XP_046430808.1 methyl-CpG-binding domain protein 3 isoform X2 [Neodiprion fabricii]XP_046487792.1 methyl-CpG-binding domain protein 3 isoform X2 [Neodiprion pinetum]XP_046624577.1 methyl-CpG-binding domain protein 3 isoform X2 [Neodiprion virginianus]
MNMSVEKKKYPSALPTNWPIRDEQSRKAASQLSSTGKVDVYYYSRGVRNDASLVPPIRQTASIFKQPVTIYKTQEGKVKDVKHGNQDKPKQLFWEKRLEGLRACDPDGYEFDGMDLPKTLKPVGPYVTEETLLQSVATALHVSSQPVTGQTGSKTALEKNPGVFLNPEQPLVQAVAIADDDIKRQEDRVTVARKKLQDALRGIAT